jgi:hypothetical protein
MTVNPTARIQQVASKTQATRIAVVPTHSKLMFILISMIIPATYKLGNKSQTTLCQLFLSVAMLGPVISFALLKHLVQSLDDGFWQ